MDGKRFLPLCGVAAVVLVVVAVAGLGGSTPGNDASAASVAAYYSAHQTSGLVAAFLLAASAPLFVLFGASVATLGTTAQSRQPIWERVLVAGSALAAAAFLVAALLTFALADVPDKLAGSAVQTLNVLSNDVWIAFNSGLGVMMLGAAGSSLAQSRLPRWLGWVALGLGIALFIPFLDFFALLLSAVWILVAAITLARRASAEFNVAPGMAS